MDEIYIRWEGEKGFFAQDLASDYAVFLGGEDPKSIRPPRLLLQSLGGCAGIYFVHIAQKMRLSV